MKIVSGRIVFTTRIWRVIAPRRDSAVAQLPSFSPSFPASSVCRRRMDTVGFRTLDSRAARDAGLGARPAERHDHDGLAGGDVAWGSHLGFGCGNGRSKFYLAWSSGSVPSEPTSDPSAFDQPCWKPRREGLRSFIYSCRTNRSDYDSTHKRVASRLKGRSSRCLIALSHPFGCRAITVYGQPLVGVRLVALTESPGPSRSLKTTRL
jgi:hypothetical protein